MSWLARARLKAFIFFAVCAGGMGYFAVRSFDHAKPAVGVVSAVGAALAVYVLGNGLVAWRRGELPVFDSRRDVRRHIRRRNRPN